MVVRWLSFAVAVLASYAWYINHAIWAQLFPKDLPHLFYDGGKCEVIRGKDVNSQFKYCEDGLVAAPGIAIFSCDPGRYEWNTVMGPMQDPDPRGGLWGMHYTSTSNENPYPIELVGFPDDADFHPLGIDITPQDNSAPTRLFVINHGRHKPTIEVFRIQLAGGVTLTYETTLSHPSIVSPNAIAAISSNAFYISNDHYFTRRMAWPFNLVLPGLETFLALPIAKVDKVQFGTDGVDQVQTVAPTISMANGVAISPDGSALAIASTNRAEVLFYSRTDNDIKLVSSARVPFSADNIVFVGDRLLVAGHPYLPAFMKLVNRQADYAPSYVVAISPSIQDGESWLARIARGADVVDVFKSDGSFFSSSSGAFVDSEMKAMLLVGLYATGIAKCEL